MRSALVSLLVLGLGAPAPLVAAGIQLPQGIERRLANGLRVRLLPDREVPLVTIAARLEGGSLEDPAGKEGATSLLADLLGKGAGERDAEAFQEAVDFLGGTFQASASHRWISVQGEFLAESLEEGLELVADALVRPRLDAGEFAKERGLAVDAVRAAREQPSSILGVYARAWLFQGHPYARPAGGDERSLEALGLEDVKAAAARQLGPARTRLVVAGDFDPDGLFKLLEKRFGAWKQPTEAPPPVPPPRAAEATRVLLVSKPDSLQTYFRFGNLGLHWSDPDYPARMVANTILGGRFTSRLNTTLRIEKGLTYGAGSSFDDRLAGTFLVQTYTQTATSKECVELALEVYRRFVAEGITQEELDSARSYIQGQYAPDNVETAAQVAGMLLELDSAGLSPDLVTGLFGRLDALGLEAVNRVIRERFPSKALTWVLIGQAEALRELAAGLGPVTEVALAGPGFGPGFP